MTVGTPEAEWSDRAGGERVVIDPPDPGWADEAERWIAAIHAGVEAPGARIEHIGSTAVPGLAAKPVIDLQLAVPDLDDERRYRTALEALGLVLRQREPGHRFFRPPAGTPRVVHVHVCEIDSAWEADHLRFRDVLRARPDLAREYEALKRSLADRFADDRGAYNAGKAQFIGSVLGDHRRGAAGMGQTPVA